MPEQTIEYPCPSCGSDGPHPVLATEDGELIVECAGDYCGEFTVPTEGVAAGGR